MDASDRNTVALAAETADAHRLELGEIVGLDANDLELGRFRIVDRRGWPEVPDFEAPATEPECLEVERIPRVVDRLRRIANVLVGCVGA